MPATYSGSPYSITGVSGLSNDYYVLYKCITPNSEGSLPTVNSSNDIAKLVNAEVPYRRYIDELINYDLNSFAPIEFDVKLPIALDGAHTTEIKLYSMTSNIDLSCGAYAGIDDDIGKSRYGCYINGILLNENDCIYASETINSVAYSTIKAQF